jgi:NAD+ kinase
VHLFVFVCPAHRCNLEQTLERALDGTLPSVSLSRMQVSVNNRICSRRVLNEALFCHAIPAATSRYIVSFAGKSEEQRSSGVWVSTAAGSTGAARSAGGRLLPFTSRQLQLIVREPYLEARRGTQPVPITLDHVTFEPPEALTLLSKMEDARLYLDGPYRQMPVGLGDRVVCSVSDEPLNVYGLGRRRLATLSLSVPARRRRPLPEEKAPEKKAREKRPRKRAG